MCVGVGVHIVVARVEHDLVVEELDAPVEAEEKAALPPRPKRAAKVSVCFPLSLVSDLSWMSCL